jgi:hypothetical protein
MDVLHALRVYLESIIIQTETHVIYALDTIQLHIVTSLLKQHARSATQVPPETQTVKDALLALLDRREL